MKQIFRFILSISAALAALSSCTDENYNLGSRVSLSRTEDLSISGEGAEDFTFTVESDGDWLVVAPSWITPSPRYGSGNGTIVLSFADNVSYAEGADGTLVRELNGSRHATVSVECASGATGFVVRQAGDPDKPSDEIKSVTIGEFLQQPDGAQIYQITGTVTSIKNTTYGNLYLNDGTGEVYIYGILDRNGNAKNFKSLGIGVGDVLTLQGSKTTYNGTVESVNAQYISHVKSLVVLAESDVTVEALENTFSVGVEYSGDNIAVDSDSQWLAFTGVATTDDGTVLTFKAYENEEAIVRKATVTVTSTLGEDSSSQTLTVTQKAATAPGGDDDGNVYTKVSAITSGGQYIIAVSGNAATPILDPAKTYGYLQKTEVTETEGSITWDDETLAFTIEEVEGGYTLKQSDGRYLYQTGNYDSFNVSDAPASGHIWSISFDGDGAVTITNNSVSKYVQFDSQYNSYGSYATTRGILPFLYGRGGSDDGDEDEDGIITATVAEFLAAPESQTQKYRLTGTISGTVNSTYGNFDLVDDTGSVYVYGLTATELGYGATNDKSYSSLGLAAGDKITLIGYRGSYGTKIEVMYSYFVSKQ